MTDARGQGTAVEPVGRAAIPLTGETGDYDPLLEMVGDASVVLLGEASHGTQEFYAQRARITQRLIEEKGFIAVAVEADWPDAYRVNCYARGASDDASADEALGGFQRFPAWMWRNTAVAEFVAWLREHNQSAKGGRHLPVGFYGLDLYSLHRSIEAVLAYLDRVDPPAAARARQRYACFDHAGQDSAAYGFGAAFGAGPSCEHEVVEQLVELQRDAAHYANRDGRMAEDELFYTEQNARLVVDAEAYYRSMFAGRVSSWNLRDRHMAGTLDALSTHLTRQLARPARLVVWEHNSHVGDARATELGEAGELNVGQLVREARPDDAVLVGFTTYSGTVTAAPDWGGPAQCRRVRPALGGSFEELFHQTGVERFLLPLGAAEALRSPKLERAIGVVYRPETERTSHYFFARLAEQFDAVVHIDETRAVEPLERSSAWEAGEPPETYPAGV